MFLKKSISNECACQKKTRLSKEERAAIKAEKKVLKERKKEIERINRMLIPVSKRTREALGILSFDSKAGVFRIINNRWTKTYELIGLTDAKRDGFIDHLVDGIDVRIRITSVINLSEKKERQRLDFLTIYGCGETYDEVKSIFNQVEDKINNFYPGVSVSEISANNQMNRIRKNNLIKDGEIDFTSSINRKSNWQADAYRDISVTDNYFEIGEQTGVCMQVIQFMDDIDTNILHKLLEINLPMMFITDIQPLSDESIEDYRRVLEKRYNRKYVTTDRIINVGFSLIIYTDSPSQKDEVIDDFEKEFSEHGMVLTPVYGNTSEIVESCLSFGIRDYHALRNIRTNQVKNLVV